MKPNSVINLLYGILALAIALAIAAALFYGIKYSYSKTESAIDCNPETLTFDTPDQQYWYLLDKIDNGFTQVELCTILGPEHKDINILDPKGEQPDYEVGANPETQRLLDEALWSYCLQTSDLFATVCNYMRSNKDYDSKLTNLLSNIFYRQTAYLNKYASDLMKKDAEGNTFKYERECLESVIDSRFAEEERLLEYLTEETPMARAQREAALDPDPKKFETIKP